MVTKETVLVLLRGHVNAETAALVEDYPYGSLRCQKRYWVERATKGTGKGRERPVTQTSNPKTGNTWQNKPKAGTFCDRVFLYRDTRNNYLHFWHVNFNGPDSFIKFIASGLYQQLNDEERADLGKWINFDRKYNGRSWREYENNLVRINAAIKTHDTLSPEELYKFFDGPINELENRDGLSGGIFESDFRAILSQIRAAEGWYTIPDAENSRDD